MQNLEPTIPLKRGIDISTITLGECLSSTDEVVRRNAMSILKQLQKANIPQKCAKCASNPKWDIYESCEHAQ